MTKTVKTLSEIEEEKKTLDDKFKKSPTVTEQEFRELQLGTEYEFLKGFKRDDLVVVSYRRKQ